MTIQSCEILYYNGKEWRITPSYYSLDEYSKAHDLEWETSFSGCWRGYTASWEIWDGQLYLVELHGSLKCAVSRNSEKVYKYVELEHLFPGKSKVLADWFTGIMQAPFGPIMGSGIQQHMLCLKFKDGKLIDQCEVYDSYLLIRELADYNVDEFVFDSKLWQDECYMRMKKKEYEERMEKGFAGRYKKGPY